MNVNGSKRYKIFISSTMMDFMNEREAIANAILELGHESIRAETYPAQPTSSREVIAQMVQESDVLLGIYGSRYGFIPRDENMSVTEMEFQVAKQLGREILIYVRETVDREPKMEEFLLRVQDFDSGLFRRPHFTAVDQLLLWIKEDIIDLVQGDKFHLFTFREYAGKLNEWTVNYGESGWGGQYTELTAKSLDFSLYAKKRGAEYDESANLSRIIEENQIALIVGEAGSGKTTTLLHELRSEADRVLSKNTSVVPVFIPLNAWTEEHNIISLIMASLASLGRQIDEQTLHTYLSQGRFLLAFDGVNEIPSTRRTQGADRDLATFMRTYSANRIIVTARSVGYDAKVFEAWPIFEIQALDQQNIYDFISKYLGNEEGKKLFRRLGGEDQSQWQKPHSLVSLARNPLHLWMLAETYRHFHTLPQDKATLIRSFTEFILEKREQGKASNYSLLVKNRILTSLAFEMTEAGEVVRTTQEKVFRVFLIVSNDLKERGLLEREVTVLDLLNEIRANNFLRLDGDNSIRWTHQLFQEFFAAQELAHRFEAGAKIWRQLNNTDWKESITMAASLTRTPENYVNEIINGWRGWVGTVFQENPRAVLAISCVTETHLWDIKELREKVIPLARSRIAKGLNQRVTQFLARLVRAVGKPFSALLLVLANRHFRSYYVQGPLLWILGEIGESNASSVCARSLHSPDGNIRWIAADALRKLKDPSVLNNLIEALGENDADVRWVVIQALINFGDSSASPALVPLLNHPDPVTRWAASFALGKLGTRANLPNLEITRKWDHAVVWWGESVSRAADIAINEIQERLLAADDHPPSEKESDMSEHVYHRPDND